MPYSLSYDDRKQILEKENIVFSNTVSLFNTLNLEKDTAYKVKKISLFDDGLSPLQVISLAHRNNIDYIVQNSLQPLSEKYKIISEIDKDQKKFFRDHFSFFENCTGRHKIIFDSTTSRKSILNLAFHRLQIDMDANRSINLKSALEELIMNAQLDAKILTDSKKNLKSILILEKCEKLVAASIIDQYGTLTYSKFISKIESVLNVGVSQSINQNRQRGAGIGSSIVFNAADSLYLGCLPGEKTRVTAIIPFGLSDKNQEKLQKSIFLL